jgi:hypothetical protein
MARRLLPFILVLVLAFTAEAQNYGNINPYNIIGNTDSTAKKPAAPVPFSAFLGDSGKVTTSSAPCYTFPAGDAKCGVLFDMIDDPASAANVGLAVNLLSTHGPAALPPYAGDFNFQYRTAFMPSIIMRGPGSSSVWAVNAAVIVDADADLTGRTANAFELDVHNRSKGTGDAAGAAGYSYTSNQVTGISLTGTGYRSTYALNIDGGSVLATEVATAGTSTNFTVGTSTFAVGDQIRVIVGSATKGQNGTVGVGKVTAAAGAVITVAWETASPGTPGVGDWVLLMGHYGTANDAVFNRGIGCANSVIQSCFHVYSPVEIGLDFNGSQTNIGIDFAKMTNLQGGSPVDIRMGPSSRINMYVPGGADLPVLATANNVGDFTQIADGSGNPTLILGGLAAGGATNIYRNAVHTFQNRDATQTFAVISTTGLNLPVIPTSAGSGGVYVCVDSLGSLYKKGACP